jgi:hypothetical protein
LRSHFPTLLHRASKTFQKRNTWVGREKKSHIETYRLKNDALLVLVKEIGKLNEYVASDKGNVDYDCEAGDQVIFKEAIYVQAILSLCLTNYAYRHEGLWGSRSIHPYFIDLCTSWW